MRLITRRRAAATIVLSAAVAAVVTAPGAASGATSTAKRQVTIAADVQTMYYGQATPKLTYTVYGLTGSDKLTTQPTCSVPAHTNVGKYAITCSGAAADTTKYTLAYVSAPLYVGKAPLYVGPNYQQKVYGEAEPAFTYAVQGLVNGDKLIATPTCAVAGAHTDAGRYKITCSGADAGTNYELRYLENVYDVAKRALVVGPQKQAIYFTMAEPAFTFGTYGLVAGEKLAKDPTCGVAGEHAHAGTYTITCTGAEATANYTLTTVTSTYTVAANKSVAKGDRAAISKNLLGQATGAKLRGQLYLVYPYAAVFPKQTLTFTSGSTTLCTGTTDADGYVYCTLTAAAAKVLAKNGSYTVTYAGQGDDIAGSSNTVKN